MKKESQLNTMSEVRCHKFDVLCPLSSVFCLLSSAFIPHPPRICNPLLLWVLFCLAVAGLSRRSVTKTGTATPLACRGVAPVTP